MAKKKKKSASEGKAAGVDGITAAAAIRWYALRIELRALELVFSHPESYEKIRDILKMAKVNLTRIDAERDFAQAACLPPWERCADNVCRPDCSEDERIPG